MRSRTATRTSSRRLNRRSPSQAAAGSSCLADRVRRRDQLGRPPDRGHPVLVGHGREQLGMAGQQVAEQPRGAEHGAEQLGRGWVVADHAVEGGPVAEGLGQHPQRRQPAVGVGRLGKPGQHHRQHGPHQRGPPRQPRGEGAQRRHGPAGVGEPEGGQPLARPPGRARPDRPEGLQRPVEQLVEAADRPGVAAPVGLEPLQGVGLRPVPVAEGGPASAAPPPPPGWCGCGARWPAGGGARPGAGTGRPRPAGRRRPGRRTRRR